MCYKSKSMVSEYFSQLDGRLRCDPAATFYVFISTLELQQHESYNGLWSRLTYCLNNSLANGQIFSCCLKITKNRITISIYKILSNLFLLNTTPYNPQDINAINKSFLQFNM